MDTVAATDIEVEERKEAGLKKKLVDYTMWSHGRQRQDEGRSMGATPGPFGCGCARKIGLTAGRGNSLAAHLLGVVI